MDVLMAGNTGFEIVSRVYHNNRDGTFTDVGARLIPTWLGAAAWGDYNNDGFLDILLTGSTIESLPPESAVARVYRNEQGTGVFTDSGFHLPGVFLSAVAWADFDNDGDQDLLVIGLSKIFRNEGDGVLVDSGVVLRPVDSAATDVGDWDNDGWVDILVSGVTGDSVVADLYRNAGDWTFSTLAIPNLAGAHSGSVGWADYDRDGDLDALVTGTPSFFAEPLTRLYRNETASANTVPASPTGLSAIVTGNDVECRWFAATDLETGSAGLGGDVIGGLAAESERTPVSDLVEEAPGSRQQARVVDHLRSGHERARLGNVGVGVEAGEGRPALTRKLCSRRSTS
ncbi:MAG: VCBS repeat-containing protein [Verrucomicrobia bacterium]|nr:VCBS repeat-containing protein [Verrucomicrobiota bacterium]